MNHRDYTQVPPSHAARHIPGKPTAGGYAVASDPGLLLLRLQLQAPHFRTIEHHRCCHPLCVPSGVGTLLPRRASTPNRRMRSAHVGWNEDRSPLPVFPQNIHTYGNIAMPIYLKDDSEDPAESLFPVLVQDRGEGSVLWPSPAQSLRIIHRSPHGLNLRAPKNAGQTRQPGHPWHR
jgi:hypothetical protein